MPSIKTTFVCAARGGRRVSLFALVLLMLVINDDRQRAEERRKKRAQAPRPAAGQAVRGHAVAVLGRLLRHPRRGCRSFPVR